MKLFKFSNRSIAKGYSVVCEIKSTRSGFKHEANMFDPSGRQCGFAKCIYYNRTWEAYEFESVLYNVATLQQDERIEKSMKEQIKSCFGRYK